MGIRRVEDLKESVRNSKCFAEIAESIAETFTSLKEQNPNFHIVYVSGIVSSDGPEFIARNVANLKKNTEIVRDHLQDKALVFSAADIFEPHVHANLDPKETSDEENWYRFWREVLCSGVTHIIMTPRWKDSKGAMDEFTTAGRLRIPIYELDADDLTNILI